MLAAKESRLYCVYPSMILWKIVSILSSSTDKNVLFWWHTVRGNVKLTFATYKMYAYKLSCKSVLCKPEKFISHSKLFTVTLHEGWGKIYVPTNRKMNWKHLIISYSVILLIIIQWVWKNLMMSFIIIILLWENTLSEKVLNANNCIK